MPAVRLDYSHRPRLRKAFDTQTNNSARDRLLRFLANEFDSQPETGKLLSEFLSHRSFSKPFFSSLLSVARDGNGTPWDLRRLAVLMMEHQILQISENNFSQINSVLNQLHLKDSPLIEADVAESVRKEGYTSTQFNRFLPEFRCRLERFNRIHSRIKGWKTLPAALVDFVAASRQECRLTLARYAFTPDEVVDEILRQVLTTEGMEDLDRAQPLFVRAEAERGLHGLPDFEAAVLRKLCDSSLIYWVSEQTSSQINSLVEYPLMTVVLVIKLPGSDVEFEIKRAGKRPPFSLGVIHSRNGYEVAPSHRLDGGNMLWLLRHESIAASKLALIYREVHREEAPLPTYVSRNSISWIPTGRGDEPTVYYFTDPEVFGEAFDDMRAAMAASVAAFTAEGYMKLPDLPGPLGLTAQFLSTVCPGQAILKGTSSFRVDRVAAYLAPDGAARFLKRFFNSAISFDHARALANTLLDEVLGIWQTPATYQNYGEYLAEVFAIPANRRRANSVYKSILAQVGKLWGTLMGTQGYSKGESFVARNVGLRTVWRHGQWQVRIIFMDHDSLVIPGSGEKDFCARAALDGMRLDETYIWGRPGGILGTAGHLRNLYRINDQVHLEARQLAEIAAKEAYQKTQLELARNPRLQSLFHPVFIERLPAWDRLVRSFLLTDPEKLTKWKDKTCKLLQTSGYEDNEVSDYLEALDAQRTFLERQSYLFSPGKFVRRHDQ